MTARLAEQIAALSWLEALAVVLAVAYLVLAIRQHIACWFCAMGSTAIYIWLFHDVALFMESALNAFYLAMAFYGFHHWRRGGARGDRAPVTTLPLAWHAAGIAAVLLLVVVGGRLLELHTRQALPYLDSLTTWGAVWATWLTARKVLENWWYWLVIDVISIYLYVSRGLPLTALLFAAYVVMIPIGFVSWRRSLHGAPAHA